MLQSFEWEEVLIHYEVTKIVETLARSENEHVMTEDFPMFEWIPGLANGDDENIDNDMGVEYINEDYTQAEERMEVIEQP